jgi:very-short-patch-repair endonuclease
MKFYIAGKVMGSKWGIVPQQPKHAWVASDGWVDPGGHRCTYDNHGCFNPTDGVYEWDHFGRHVAELACTQIRNSDGVIAYVECPSAYGTLVEVGYALGCCKPTVLFVQEWEESDFLTGLMHDAYRFAGSMPTIAHMSTSFGQAREFAGALDLLESPIEVRLGIALWSQGIRWTPQHKIGKYRLDFACPEYKLAIECDGHQYHSTKEQRGYDADRDRFLLKEGWQTARFTGTQIHQDAAKCANDIWEIIYKKPYPTTRPQLSIAQVSESTASAAKWVPF